MEENKEPHLDLLKKYITSWLGGNLEMFLSTLNDTVDIRECYGASYSSKEEASAWFAEWNKKGKVLEWEITDSYFDPMKNVFIATWKFHYEYPGADTPRFDGITIMTAVGGRIRSLYEYETKHERYYPYKAAEKCRGV